MSNAASSEFAQAHSLDHDYLVGLITRVATQDKAAFQEFYHATSAKLLGIIYCIVRDITLAEDILQEIYLKVWQRASDFDSEHGTPIAWVTTLARNRALDEVRKRTHLISSDDVAGFDNIPADMVQSMADRLNEEHNQFLLSCLNRLEDSKQEMILAAYTFGIARDKLAEQFNIPLATVKTWLRRALTDLRACMVSDHV